VLLNLVVLCYIVSVALPPSKQEGHFATVFVAMMRLLRTSLTLFFNVIILFRCSLTYYASLIDVLVAFFPDCVTSFVRRLYAK
jgi:hypothetical protein